MGTQEDMQQYLSDKELAARYGVHRDTIWRWAESGHFPKPVKLAKQCTRWKLEDVQAFEASRPTAH